MSVVAGGGGVALGEDQEDGGEHRAKAAGELGWSRDPVRGVVVAELALGPHDALGDGRLGRDERAGDLRSVEPAQQPQRERDLRVGRQRRVAAQEHQPQLVVGDHVDEPVELVEVGVVAVVAGVHVGPVEVMAKPGDGPRGSTRAGGDRWRGCGRS